MEPSRLTPKTTSALILLLCIAAAATALVSADKFVVGDKQRWAPNVNYTEWSAKYDFHVGDWLVFYYERGMYDVMEVNATAYDACSSDAPLVNWSRGPSFAYQLNRTGRYYFICSRGYCYNGMKLTILAEPLPPPSSPPSAGPQHSSSASPRRRFASWIAVAVAFILKIGFPQRLR